MKELTEQQIKRQDFVDNAINDLINNLNPSGEEVVWDIGIIADVRDTIQAYLVDQGFCSEQEFYPYIEE